MRLRIQQLSIAFGVFCVIGVLGACGSTAENSSFDDAGAGEGGRGSSSGVGPIFQTDGSVNQDDSGNTSGDIPDGGCVGDVCTSTTVCGDSKVDPSEQCDDGNGVPGDGCSGTCQIEPGYACPTVGEKCIYTVKAVCGNGKIEGEEACDDGNANDLDGCSAGCEVEPNYTCATPNAPCTKVIQPRCGDGAVDFGEQCDDGNNTTLDGCDASCQLEPGYSCPQPGQKCKVNEFCGDSIVQNDANESETCDDGNAKPFDGCSAFCQTEPGYSCTTPGSPCTKIWVCGNGKVDPGESCDDGNTTGGDGCTANCGQVEPGFTCPGTGGMCAPAPSPKCGDGKITGTEQCDDGNITVGDGCGATCAIEAGYTCPNGPGKACLKIAVCGDKVLDPGEACDDGNKTGGDGCSTTCQVEANFVCKTPGQLCTSTVVCGDGTVSGTETCDDKNKVSSDGCSSTCVLEAGWQCPNPGASCIAKKCGDGIKAGNEQCDDGDTNDTNGCSNTCKLVPGYACTGNVGQKTVCTVTTCGDKKKEGFEQCDDGNLEPYDGCSPTCTIEPQCSGGTCTAVCGDGFKFSQEDCDDGNNINGDGCSSTCKLEDPTGKSWTCVDQTQPPPGSLTIPILYRDMLFTGTNITTITPPGLGHPDFNRDPYSGQQGLVLPTLDTSTPYGKPQFAMAGGSLSNAQNFCWWYHDTDCDPATPGGANPYAKIVYLDAASKPQTLTLGSTGTNTYQYASTAFFPVTGLGWDTIPAAVQDTTNCAGAGPFNFSFTSELHYPFTYKGGEKFDFVGDDDVWVFINGQLAVDIGGIHGAEGGSITLSEVANNRTVGGSTDTKSVTGSIATGGLGLVVGKLYEISMFQAERHTCDSDYTLTLSGFNKVTTSCTPVCGDGKLEGNEVCDDGVNSGLYGSCAKDCSAREPFCGDATKTTPPEACDDGLNTATYGGTAQLCGPGCKIAPYCGDATLSNGEQCDDGSAKNTGLYGACSKTCTLGPRCGDGTKNGPTGGPLEQCDDGVNNGQGVDACNKDCTLRCGDAKVEAGEGCDDGTAKNTGGYGKCNADCTKGPFCGDGFTNGTEQCDDGKNDGSYGTCNSDCTLAGYCGDGTLTNPPETCDLGNADSASAYGKSTCTNQCLPGPYCGDKAVDGKFGEVCDDGKNDGSAGSCTPDCKNFVPFKNCGNGTVDTGEQCDDGTAKNGTAGDACDTHCHKTCGNGIVDVANGETCDNGVNDGSYGGCTPTCQIGPYCGDGVKSGTEACDNGNSNVSVSTAYGFNICTTACQFAGYCGDGRVQSGHGEQCDGGGSCDANCKTTGPK